jgi:phosphoketolase
VLLTAVGAYQLGEVLKASERLAARRLAHAVIYMLEPGRFRAPRSEGEQRHRARLYPDTVTARVFLTHTRPEVLLGVFGPLHTGPGTLALGFSNHGGTLSVDGLMFVNGSTWAHCLRAVAQLLGHDRRDLLTAEEIDALDRRRSPHGVIIDEV